MGFMERSSGFDVVFNGGNYITWATSKDTQTVVHRGPSCMPDAL